MPPTGVHLVGSAPFSSTETAFRECCAGLSNRLKRLPDGETGVRYYFTLWQAGFFKDVPEMMTEFASNAPVPAGDFSEEQVREGIERLEAADPSTGYDTAAVESYSVFQKLRAAGGIRPDTKFQVCLPTPASVIAPFVQRTFQPAAAPIYEKALFRAMQNIQAAIPHSDLSIQIDLAADTAFWEGGACDAMYPPWFCKGQSMEARKAYIVDYVVRMMGQVAEEVELGIHNCYGDMEHRHWMEPADLSAITERGLALFEASPHKIGYFHLPVPVSAMGRLDAFYEPLKALLPRLREHGTELYLGCVREGDVEGTKERIAVAERVLEGFPFGVATGCGWGRMGLEAVEEVMGLLREVAEPVVEDGVDGTTK